MGEGCRPGQQGPFIYVVRSLQSFVVNNSKSPLIMNCKFCQDNFNLLLRASAECCDVVMATFGADDTGWKNYKQ